MLDFLRGWTVTRSTLWYSIACLFLCPGSAEVFAQAPTSSFDCVFDRHYATYLNHDRTEKYEKPPTRLSFIANRTTASTLALDGSVRATNSSVWTLVARDNLGGHYIGDDGDLLTILYIPDDGPGEYQASLQWTELGYAFASIGKCSGEP